MIPNRFLIPSATPQTADVKSLLEKLRAILNGIGPSRLVLLVILAYWCTLLLEEKRWEDGKIIVSDIKGYYIYVPAFLFNDDPHLEEMHLLTDEAKSKIWYDHVDGKNFARMYIGTSVCYAPFSMVAHAVAKSSDKWEANGYSTPYYVALGISALFFGLWGLWLVRQLCREFLSDLVAAIVLLLLAFGTNLTFYATYYGPYSHIYSFWAIAMFVWLTIKWHKQPKLSTSIFLGLAAGLVTIIRPTNVVVILLFVFWAVTSITTLKEKFALFWQHKMLLLATIISGVAILMIQLGYWKFALGSWVYYTYGQQGFDFGNPEFFNVLFSFRKGWLLYTPLMVFSIVGLFFLGRKISKSKWIIPILFLLHLYIVASWHSWWYGDAFSQRPILDMYAILALPIGAFFAFVVAKKNLLINAGIAAVVLAGLYLNTFQMQQYKNGIIHYDGMTKEAYMAVWLKDRFPLGYDNLIIHPDLHRLATFQGEYIPSIADFKTNSSHLKTYNPRLETDIIPEQLSSAIIVDSTYQFSPVLGIPLENLSDTNTRYRAICTANFYVEQVTSHEQFSFFLSSVAQEKGHYKRYDSWQGEITQGGRTSMTHTIDLWTPFSAADSLKLVLQHNFGPPIYLESFEVEVVECAYPE